MKAQKYHIVVENDQVSISEDEEMVEEPILNAIELAPGVLESDKFRKHMTPSNN